MNAHQRRVRRRKVIAITSTQQLVSIFGQPPTKEDLQRAADAYEMMRREENTLGILRVPPSRTILDLTELQHELMLVFRSVLLMEDNRIDDPVRYRIRLAMSDLFMERVAMAVSFIVTCDATNNPPSVVNEGRLIASVYFTTAEGKDYWWVYEKGRIGVSCTPHHAWRGF